MKLLEYLDEWLVIHPPTHSKDERGHVVTITDFREATRSTKINQRKRYDHNKIIELYRKFVHSHRRPPYTLTEFCQQSYAPSRATVKKFFRDLDDLIFAAGPIPIPIFTPKTEPDPALNKRALKVMQLRSAGIRQTQHIGFDQLTGITESERQYLQAMAQKHAQTERAKSIAYRIMERWMTFQTKSRNEYLHRITMIYYYHGDGGWIHRADYYGFERIVRNVEYRLENNLAVDNNTLIRSLMPIRKSWLKELAMAQAAETLEAKRQADKEAREANTAYVTDMEWYRRTVEQTKSLHAAKTEPRQTCNEPSDDERKLRIAQYEVDLWNAAERSNQRKSDRRRAANQTAKSSQTQQSNKDHQTNQSNRANQSDKSSNTTHTTYYSHTTTHTYINPDDNITSQINTFVKDVLTSTRSFLRNLFS